MTPLKSLKHRPKLLLGMLVLVLVLGSGIRVSEHDLLTATHADSTIALDHPINAIGFRDTTDRAIVDCKRAMHGAAVILTLGQSNAANYGASRYDPRSGFLNFNFFDGNCYRALDPLLGASGPGGSVWSRLGDLLVAKNIVPDVVVAPLAVNSSSIELWLPGGELHKRIDIALKHLRSQDLEPTHVLWHQGERDAMDGMSRERYAGALSDLIRSLRAKDIKAPIYVAKASICKNEPNAQIRTAQEQVVQAFDNVFPGPDTDTLNDADLRYDGCHFTGEGLVRHAVLWFEALTQTMD